MKSQVRHRTIGSSAKASNILWLIPIRVANIDMKENVIMTKNTYFEKSEKTRTAKSEPDPIGSLLLDALVSQINDFLGTDPVDRSEAIKDLFDVGPYPAGLTGSDEAKKYDVYLMQRTARMSRDDDTKHRRLSCDIVMVERDTGTPMYFAKSYITPDDIAAVEVYCADRDRGTDYRKTLRWTNRPARDDG